MKLCAVFGGRVMEVFAQLRGRVGKAGFGLGVTFCMGVLPAGAVCSPG